MKRAYHLACLDKFPHWSEYLAPLGYGLTEKDFSFLSFKKGPDYVDPLGTAHKIHTKGWYDGNDQRPDIFLCSGDIHRQTHPLSVGTVPYDQFTRKIVLPHTVGLAPYDVHANGELAALTGHPGAKGAKITDIVKGAFVRRFMNTDFHDDQTFYVRPTKERVNLNEFKLKLAEWIGEGSTVVRDIEPSQFWLDSVPVRQECINDKYVGVALNWCSLRSAAYCNHIFDQLQHAAQRLNKVFVVRMHSYARDFDGSKWPYLDFRMADGMSKYDFMDSFMNYVVDGTGWGYECAYRRRNSGVNFYQIKTLCNQDEFSGIEEMDVLPVHNLGDWVRNPGLQSNYPAGLIADVFPHVPGSDIPSQCRRVIYDILDKEYD